MEGSEFTEARFFGAIAESGARVLLIGRRAMVALGIPVLTADYDLWVAFDDVEKLNEALAPLDFVANRAPGVTVGLAWLSDARLEKNHERRCLSVPAVTPKWGGSGGRWGRSSARTALDSSAQIAGAIHPLDHTFFEDFRVELAG